MHPSQNIAFASGKEFIRDLSTAVLKIYAEEYDRELKAKSVEKTSRPIPIDDPTVAGSVVEKPVLSAKTCEDGIKILEAISSTGVSSIRYAKDIPRITKIIANNPSEDVVRVIKTNIAAGGVEHLVMTACDTAPMIMYKNRKHSDRFNVVDVDPRTDSISKYLDTAVQCVCDGGLLLVTCTDTTIGSGSALEECYRNYGAVSPKISSWREMTLRVVLKCIESHANRHGRYIEPLLSVYAGDYVRIFVKVFIGPVVCKQTLSKLSMVYQCVGCHSFTLQPLGVAEKLGEQKNRYKFSLPRGPPVDQHCEHCNNEHNIGGPIWSGPLHNDSYVSRLADLVRTEEFSTGERIKNMLAAIQEELNKSCLYYTLDDIHAVIPTNPLISALDLRSALMNAGYQVSHSHAQEGSIKTDATSLVLWDIIRCWARDHPSSNDKLDETARTILARHPVTAASFNPVTTSTTYV